MHEVRSLKVVNTGITDYKSINKKEDAVYIDSASDVHILWD